MAATSAHVAFRQPDGRVEVCSRMSAPARPPYTHEGHKRAKERGVRCGRPRKLTRANHRLAQPVTRAAHSSGRVAASFRRIGFETSGKTERRFAAQRAGVARPNLA